MIIISVLVLLYAVSTANAQPSCLVNWDEEGEEAIQRLDALVPINTTNPPGNEMRVAEYLGGVLAAAG